jgi:hypothetical protein
MRIGELFYLSLNMLACESYSYFTAYRVEGMEITEQMFCYSSLKNQTNYSAE